MTRGASIQVGPLHLARGQNRPGPAFGIDLSFARASRRDKVPLEDQAASDPVLSTPFPARRRVSRHGPIAAASSGPICR